MCSQLDRMSFLRTPEAISFYHDDVRKDAWEEHLCTSAEAAKQRPLYQDFKAQLPHRSSAPIRNLIKQDVDRTQTARPDAIESVLRSYSRAYRDLGYAQGMNHIVGILFDVFQDEEMTFAALIGLLEDKGLRHLYDTEHSLLKSAIEGLNEQLKAADASLHAHIQDINVKHVAQNWFQGLFIQHLSSEQAIVLLDPIVRHGQAMLVPLAVALLCDLNKRHRLCEHDSSSLRHSLVHLRDSKLTVDAESVASTARAAGPATDVTRFSPGDEGEDDEPRNRNLCRELCRMLWPPAVSREDGYVNMSEAFDRPL